MGGYGGVGWGFNTLWLYGRIGGGCDSVGILIHAFDAALLLIWLETLNMLMEALNFTRDDSISACKVRMGSQVLAANTTLCVES